MMAEALRNALIELGWATEDAIDFAEDMTPWIQERIAEARREERERNILAICLSCREAADHEGPEAERVLNELRERNAYDCEEGGCDAPHVALYADERDAIFTHIDTLTTALAVYQRELAIVALREQSAVIELTREQNELRDTLAASQCEQKYLDGVINGKGGYKDVQALLEEKLRDAERAIVERDRMAEPAGEKG